MNGTARFLLALSAVVFTAEAQAAQSNFGTSAAQLCYQAATYGPSPSDLQVCTHAIDDEDMTRLNLAATYSNRGIVWGARGRLDRALEDQNKSIGLNPESARAYINRANVQYRLKKYDAALADYGKAIDFSGGNLALVYYNRSLALAAVGNRNAAIADMQHALQLAPGNVAYLNALNNLQ